MRINGYGVVAIVNRANKERWPAPGKKSIQQLGESLEDFELRQTAASTWHTSTVGRLLKNRAVLGEYQPHALHPSDETKRLPVGEPVKDYYPAILDEVTFLRAQATAERRGRFPGRRDANMRNWLQGLVKCSCGHSLVRKNKHSKAQPNYARYYCTARVRRLSDCPGVSASELEGAVLYVVSYFLPGRFGATSVEELKARIEILERDVANTKKARDRYADALGLSEVSVDALVERLDATQSMLKKYEHELSSARAELADVSFDQDVAFDKLASMASHRDDPDTHATLREELARALDKIVVHQNEGYVRVFIRGEQYPTVQLLRPDGVLP
jgi:hypothetical protein